MKPCENCGGRGFIALDCGDPDCCGPEYDVPCQVCNPEKEDE